MASMQGSVCPTIYLTNASLPSDTTHLRNVKKLTHRILNEERGFLKKFVGKRLIKSIVDRYTKLFKPNESINQ